MPAAPTSHTFVDGVQTTSELNAYIRDPITFWAQKPMAELRQLVAQTLTTAVFGSITFTTEDFDGDWVASSGGGHDNSTNPSRYTALYDGWYVLGGGVSFAINATGQRGCRWAVNGSAVNGSAVVYPATAGNVIVVAARTKRVFLNIGDYVELQGYQTSGGNLDTFVSAEFSCSMSLAMDRLA